MKNISVSHRSLRELYKGGAKTAKNILTRILDLPFHPLLFGIYPVLALYLFNIEEAPLSAVSRSLVFSLALMIGICLLFLLLFLPWRSILSLTKIFYLTLTALILGLSYYFIYTHAGSGTLAFDVRHRQLLPIWLAVFLLISTGILIKDVDPRSTFIWDRAGKAALASSLFFVLFYAFGHVIQLYFDDPGMGRKAILAQNWNLLRWWILILAAGMIFIPKIKNMPGWTKTLNLIALFLTLSVILQIALYLFSASSLNSELPPQAEVAAQATDGPDIYYILIDAYARQDALMAMLDLDNSDFIREIEDMGFVVADCSNSNYSFTLFSMTSVLNMDYLNNLGIASYDAKKIESYEFGDLIKHSRVRQYLEDRGYATVTFKIVNPYLDISDSTIYYDYSSGSGDLDKVETLNFYYLFLQTTAARPLLEYIEANPKSTEDLPPLIVNWLPVGNAFGDRNYKQYQLTLYNLESLKAVSKNPVKKFVYAHLIITHEPYVFTPDGKFRYPVTGDDEAYIDQVRFADNRLPGILREIIKNSKKPPIIILQSDHGFYWGERRNQNLSAFYLPDGGNDLIYPEITPVNIFRIVFNRYFGGPFELLPDEAHISQQNKPFNVSVEPSACLNK